MAVEDKFADEVMSDAELEQVAGGGTRQTVGDGKFLMSFGYMENGNPDYFLGWEKSSAKVDAGWAKVGITCVTKFGCPDNKYFAGSQEISRKEAFRIFLRKKGYSEDAINNYDFDQWSGSF